MREGSRSFERGGNSQWHLLPTPPRKVTEKCSLQFTSKKSLANQNEVIGNLYEISFYRVMGAEAIL